MVHTFITLFNKAVAHPFSTCKPLWLKEMFLWHIVSHAVFHHFEKETKGPIITRSKTRSLITGFEASLRLSDAVSFIPAMVASVSLDKDS